jgi:gluconate 2-dehydrogenase gamma chain
VRIFDPRDKRHLDDAQEKALDVLFEAILPGTDTSPGARDAKAARYVSVMLAVDDPRYYEIPPWRELYEQALPALDSASEALNAGRKVADLGPGEATSLLRSLASGTLEGLPPGLDQKRLFSTLRGHCIEGCFADPRWGGNDDAVIWRWFGYAKPAEEFSRQGAG